jgi:hypothetical protein
VHEQGGLSLPYREEIERMIDEGLNDVERGETVAGVMLFSGFALTVPGVAASAREPV